MISNKLQVILEKQYDAKKHLDLYEPAKELFDDSIMTPRENIRVFDREDKYFDEIFDNSSIDEIITILNAAKSQGWTDVELRGDNAFTFAKEGTEPVNDYWLRIKQALKSNKFFRKKKILEKIAKFQEEIARINSELEK